MKSPADIAIFGGSAGSGKSFSLLLEPLRHVQRVKGFDAVIFRRTSPEITNAGGLWDESYKIYPQLNAHSNESDLKWHFPPHENSVHFAHMEHEKNRFSWQGSQIALIGFDELTSFSEEQFFYMLSRNRTTCGVRPYVRASTNPDADSWVATLLAWWINQETGFPIPERAGVLRWFVRVESDFVWADSPDELQAKYPQIPPKSLTFVPALIYDNVILMKSDPGYLANLYALPAVERARLLGGNWKIRPSAGLVFNRDDFQLIPSPPEVPVQARVRYWDKAGTAGGGAYTAGVRMARTFDGQYVVEDVVRGQWSSLERNKIMLQTALFDGIGCQIWVEQEPGSGGRESADASVRELAGFTVRIERVTGDKATRAAPFSAQVQAHNVLVVRAAWTKAFIDEHDGFPVGRYMDQVDAASGAFNKLAGALIIPDFDEALEMHGDIPAEELGGSFLD
jgi:predicted phage terminase large subunit-like protein